MSISLILLPFSCSIQLSYVMAGYSFFVCPVEFNSDRNSFEVDCEPSDLFQLQDYALPAALESLTGWVSLICSLSVWLAGLCL